MKVNVMSSEVWNIVVPVETLHTFISPLCVCVRETVELSK